MSSLLAEAINGQRGDGQCLTAGQLTRPLSEWISRFERDASQQGAVLAILNTMPDATPSYWNLTQAIAWMVFRNLSVTNRFGEPKTEDWSAYMQYPSMWPTSADDEAEEPRTAPIPGDDKERLEQRAILYASMQDTAKKKVDEFREALQSGRITAYGWVNTDQRTIQPIPTIEWQSLILDPPQAFRFATNGQKIYPWDDIRFEAETIATVWPGEPGAIRITKKNPRKDWAAVDRAIGRLPEEIVDLGMSDRFLAERVMKMMKRNEIDPKLIPGDRALRDYISKQRKSGVLPKRNRD
ncbi:MAG: hypothetical protein HQ502_03275 [Alphaproteobacteria bacterium]|nr:hypothetical protein [Alphaproteobacteria bacterium]